MNVQFAMNDIPEKVKSEHPPSTSSKKEQLIHSLSTCPPVTPFSTIISLILLLGFLYGSFWSLMADIALPGGAVFGLFVLVIVCYLGGQLVRVFKIPSLVGMMLCGFILRNVPYIDVANSIPRNWAATIRNFALVLILLRAGLEVDPDVIKNNKSICTKLILIPFVFEFVIAAVVSHFLLDMEWLYAFLTGFMLSAVSPAVVLPVMLKLQKKGIGVTNGIPTVVIAVAGFDDVLALTGFEVVLGITFSEDSLQWTIGKAIIEILIGFSYGVILGLICWYFPNPKEEGKNVFRFCLLAFGAIFIMFGSQALKYGGAGALGCICLPFVAAIRWKKQDWKEKDNPIADSLAFIWRIIEPFLFGLIGSEIRIHELDASTVGIGLAILFIGLVMRMIAAFVAAYGDVTLKEQVFVMFAGLPKATVQAAIGPVVHTYTQKLKLGEPYESYGFQIVTIAVLSILITAPLGATAIALLAPRLLDNEKDGIKDIKETLRENPEERRISIFELDSNIYTVARL